uniref:Reverse transcriptase Ty1/copia-type domain-containing protein n=1 Tax=Solanum lycopersicum TaxID=4081 RepID=A0A3Q7I4I4_SOLLC
MQGFKKTSLDHCAFVQKFSDGDFIIVVLFVDDMLVVGHNTCRIQKLKQELSKSFAMKELGTTRQILDMQIVRDRKAKKFVLSQEKYIQKVLRRFSMDKAKGVSASLAMHFKLSTKQCPSSDDEKEDMKKVHYASIVGSLMYVMVYIRPDITHAVGIVSHFLSNPEREHWNDVKWPIICGYTDSDMAGDIDTPKSTSGYLVTFAGRAVSWQSRLQKCVALSTTEAELIAVVEACKELIWMKRFLGELGCAQERDRDPPMLDETCDSRLQFM